MEISQQNSIEKAFSKIGTVMSSTDSIRQRLIDKLVLTVDAYDFKIKETSARDRESFMSIINTLEGLLKGKERAVLDEVKVLLSKQTSEDNHNVAEYVTELLRTLTPISQTKTNAEPANKSDDKLEGAFNSSGDKILDGELTQVEGIGNE